MKLSILFYCSAVKASSVIIFELKSDISLETYSIRISSPVIITFWLSFGFSKAFYSSYLDRDGDLFRLTSSYSSLDDLRSIKPGLLELLKVLGLEEFALSSSFVSVALFLSSILLPLEESLSAFIVGVAIPLEGADVSFL